MIRNLLKSTVILLVSVIAASACGSDSMSGAGTENGATESAGSEEVSETAPVKFTLLEGWSAEEWTGDSDLQFKNITRNTNAELESNLLAKYDIEGETIWGGFEPATGAEEAFGDPDIDKLVWVKLQYVHFDEGVGTVEELKANVDANYINSDPIDISLGDYPGVTYTAELGEETAMYGLLLEPNHVLNIWVTPATTKHVAEVEKMIETTKVHKLNS